MVAMHLLVPFAAPLSDAGRAALSTLQLPRLQALLARLGEPRRDDGDEWSLSPPHERVLAREAGEAGVADGLVPLAALEARRAGLASAGSPEGWAWLWPAHWRLGTEQVSLHDPAALQLDEAQSRALLQAVAPLFLSEGFELHYRLPHAWLCRHDALAGLPTASADRVIGRNVDRWLGADPRGRLLRRLQNEVQMLLHDHPLNARREARGELPVNSLWVSGTGCAPPRDLPPGLVVDDRLRAPALAEDWDGWCRAWAALDAGAIASWADRHAAAPGALLTLCGERASVSWHAGAAGPGLLARLLRGRSASARRSRAVALLESL
jgi:hypothetical protein